MRTKKRERERKRCTKCDKIKKNNSAEDRGGEVFDSRERKRNREGEKPTFSVFSLPPTMAVWVWVCGWVEFPHLMTLKRYCTQQDVDSFSLVDD